jgi:hypothetical protein
VTAIVVRDRGDLHTDPAALFVSALADEIADRLATRLGPQLVEIVEANRSELISHERPRAASIGESSKAESPEDALWTAGRVAAHYDVAVRFIYQHADDLGCVRLGAGARPRLRFDPDVVRERWPRVGGALPELGPTRLRSTPRSEPSRRRRPASFELLDFDREP